MKRLGIVILGVLVIGVTFWLGCTSKREHSFADPIVGRDASTGEEVRWYAPIYQRLPENQAPTRPCLWNVPAEGAEPVMSNVSPGKPHYHGSGLSGVVFDDIDQLWIYVEPFRDRSVITAEIETVTPKLLCEELKKKTFSSSKVRIMDETTGIPVNVVENMRQAILWVIISRARNEKAVELTITLKFERFVSLPWRPSSVLTRATLYETGDHVYLSRENCLEELSDRLVAKIEEGVLRNKM